MYNDITLPTSSQYSDFELLGVVFVVLLISGLLQASIEGDEDFPNNDLK